MKLTLLTLMLGANSLMAFYSPKMRANFGANHAILRMDIGYYSYLCKPTPVPVTDGLSTQQLGHHHDRMQAMTLNIESMIMVNNRNGSTESIGRLRPTFLHGKLNYDGFSNTSLMSASYAHSTTCQTGFLFFGRVRGYLSAGVAMRYNGSTMFPEDNQFKNIGGRFGYNVYNENCALQFETYVFSNKIVVNTMAHRKIGNNFLISGGIENNKPKAGCSVMMGKGCRMSASARMAEGTCMQAGVNMSVNF